MADGEQGKNNCEKPPEIFLHVCVIGERVMYRSAYEQRLGEANEINRNLVQGTATLCSSSFGKAWKGIFPRKAAEELAARTGQSIRAAAYQLSGEHEPSARSIAALVVEVIPKR